MKIFIDSTLFIIYEWKDGKKDKELLNHMGPYNAPSFQKLVDKVLTPAQQSDYNGGDYDRVYTLSKKKTAILMAEIDKLK
jgi:hypothetical protein